MKTGLIYMFLSLVLLCACDGSDEELSDRTQQPGETLKLTVSAGDFVTYGDTPDTRAADDGAATTFENGDCIGVIVLEGSDLKGNNLPYKYNGSSWSFDAATANSEGTDKSVYYYDNQATDVTYIVYFPYSTDADGVISIEGDSGLKSKFNPKKDQQPEENYRASDLMTWQSIGSAQKTLSVTLTHAYNSVSIQPKVHYTLDDGQDTDFLHPAPAISDVYFVTGEKDIVIPYAAEDGSYRYILPADFTGDVRCFYTLDNKTYNKAFTVSASAPALTSNIRYSSTQKVDAGVYSLDKARLGDFYCRNSSSESYLIPNEAESLPEGTECIGIVYWLGDIKEDNYGLLNDKFPDGTHGLVVSLWDMPAPDNGNTGMTWTYGGYEWVNDWLGSNGDVTCTWDGRPKNFTSIQERGKMQGYANTIALEEYNKYVENKTGDGYGSDSNKRVKPVKGLAAFQTEHPAPSSSSGWYWPSVYELKYVCWGQGNEQSTSGKNMLNRQIGKVGGGNTFGLDDYWSSTEGSNGNGNYTWCVGFDGGYMGSYGHKLDNTYRVRPLVAF